MTLPFTSTTPAEAPSAADLLPALLATVPAGVALLTPVTDAAGVVTDFVVAYLNPAARRLLGLAALPTATVAQLYPALQAGGTLAWAAGVLASGRPGRRRLRYPVAGGLLGYRLAGQRVAQGLLLSFVPAAPVPTSASARPASPAHEQAAHLLERAPAGLGVLSGPAGVHEFVNPSYQALFPGRELLGRCLAEVLPAGPQQVLPAILHRVHNTGKPYVGKAVRVPLTRAAGGPAESRYLDLTCLPRHNEQGQSDGLLLYTYDVTAEVLARQRAEALQAEWTHIFEQAPIGMAIYRGPQHVIEFVNPALCAFWGRTVAQALGQPLFKLLPEAARQGFEQMLEGVMATGVPAVAHERVATVHRHGRRDTTYWNFVFQPLREGPGPVTAVLALCLDVTEQVLARQQVQTLNDELATRSEELATSNEELLAANEELHRANQQLTRANAQLDLLLDTASRNLRAPLATIEQLLLTLHREQPIREPGGQPPALLELLQQATGLLEHTVRQLTEVSHAQHPYEPASAPVPLAHALRQVLHELDASLRLAGASVELLVPELVTVTLPEKSLRTIALNLLSNALKFRCPKLPLRIRLTYWPQPEVQGFSVQDNGLGLEVDPARPCAMFQRQHPHIEGAGVGLYIVEKILENAGGGLTVQSQPGQGAIFSVYFPRQASGRP